MQADISGIILVKKIIATDRDIRSWPWPWPQPCVLVNLTGVGGCKLAHT